MIGILLGDGHLRREGTNKRNSRILFGQSLVNFPYLWYVFILLSPYCAGLPYLDSSVIKGVRHYRAIFTTRTYIVFNQLHDPRLRRGENGKKIIPQDI